MEYPPPEWNVFPAEQFDTAGPRDPGTLGLELLIQIRDTGRAQDHFRVALGGSELLTGFLPMRDILHVSKEFPPWTIEYSKWPTDIILARNRTTSVWVDMMALIESREVIIKDDDDRVVPYEDVLEELAKETHVSSVPSCSARWAAGVSDSDKMVLMLQVLPATADFLNGRPITRG
jgi:hypothetical protein